MHQHNPHFEHLQLNGLHEGIMDVLLPKSGGTFNSILAGFSCQHAIRFMSTQVRKPHVAITH